MGKKHIIIILFFQILRLYEKIVNANEKSINQTIFFNTFMTNQYIQYVYNLIKTNFHTNIIFPSEENKKLKFIFVFTFINFP